MMNRLLLFILFHVMVMGQVQIGDNINGRVAGDNFGRDISLSSDGRIMAVGAPGSTNIETATKLVQVFESQGNTWTQIGQDINGDEV